MEIETMSPYEPPDELEEKASSAINKLKNNIPNLAIKEMFYQNYQKFIDEINKSADINNFSAFFNVIFQLYILLF